MNSVLIAAEFLSLWASLTGIGLAIVVVRHWWPAVQRFFREPQTRTSACWLALGVFISFFFDVFDSGYWHLAWSAEYLGLPIRAFLFRHGVLINFPFRNLALIAAAYCHCRAYLAAHPDLEGNEALRTVGYWAFIGFLGVVVLTGLREFTA